jgi:TRAP-type C4-dicarboxylate transport system permease large subunit
MSPAALGVLGLIVGFAFSDRPFWNFLGQTVWTPSSSFVLVAVPLFLLMGEILLRAGLSSGSTARSTCGSTGCPAACCTPTSRLAACSRRSPARPVATAATMGSVALPFFHGTRYDNRMVLGSLAAGGALGNLIPPGITFIIYALITETRERALSRGGRPELLVVALFIW